MALVMNSRDAPFTFLLAHITWEIARVLGALGQKTKRVFLVLNGSITRRQGSREDF